MELTNQSVSELLRIEPPISEDNPVTPMFAETALANAAEHFDKAMASLFVAQHDERFRSAELSMLVTAMSQVGDSLRESAQAAKTDRTSSAPPAEKGE